MEKVLEVNNLCVAFKKKNRYVDVLKNISLYINKGETVGVVGESGCGKSVTSLTIMDLLPISAKVTGGEINLNGQSITHLSKNERRKLRGKEISMIFQEPMTSLNPVYKIGDQIIEMIRNHQPVSKKQAKLQALEMLKKVKIPRAEEVIDEYPHQLSGGMRQRVMIAMAMSCNPHILIADEPTTALDVTIQAQILALMKELQASTGMSIILITHDLGVVAEMCDRVIVMYAGEVVEEAPVKKLFEAPAHPYTEGLIKSVPKLGEKSKFLFSIPGRVPSPDQMSQGCRFAERCEKAFDKCFIQAPPLFQVDAQTKSRCWLLEDEQRGVS